MMKGFSDAHVAFLQIDKIQLLFRISYRCKGVIRLFISADLLYALGEWNVQANTCIFKIR